MRPTLSIKSPWLWGVTVIASVAAAWLVASAGSSAESLPQERGNGKEISEKLNRNPSPAFPARSERKSAPRKSESNAPGSFVTIPSEWMKLTGAGLHRPEIQKVLGLNHPESKKIEEVSAKAMQAAKELQIAGIDDFVLKENESLRLPALSDAAIRPLTDEVLAALPERAAAADQELAAFLMERSIREDYGKSLVVTLKFTGGISTWSIRSSPKHLLGFTFLVETEDGSDEPTSHMIGGSGRLSFLQVDPSVTNEGRNPLEQ